MCRNVCARLSTDIDTSAPRPSTSSSEQTPQPAGGQARRNAPGKPERERGAKTGMVPVEDDHEHDHEEEEGERVQCLSLLFLTS